MWLPGKVDAREEVLLHERAVAALVVRRQPDELVEVERVRLRKIRAARFVQPRELVVHRERRASRRQPQHRCRLARQLGGDGGGRCVRGFLGCSEYAEVHVRLGR